MNEVFLFGTSWVLVLHWLLLFKCQVLLDRTYLNPLVVVQLGCVQFNMLLSLLTQNSQAFEAIVHCSKVPQSDLFVVS